MSLKRKTPALLALAVLLLVAADKPDKVKGIWVVTTQTLNGVRLPNDPTGGPSLTAFDGKTYVQRQGIDIVEEGTYEVDPTKTPATIDFVIEKGPESGKRQLGIYKVEADNTLTVCLTQPGTTKRPKDFDASGGSERLLVVSRRYRP